MVRVIWSPSARDNLRSIRAYISRDSESRADQFIQRLIEAGDRVALFPEAGRVIPEIGDPSCREIIVRPYRIMYKIQRDAVWITNVIHGALDWLPDLD